MSAFLFHYQLIKQKMICDLFQLISSVDPKFLKLTKLDDKIYSSFRETFKDLDVKLLKSDDLKSDKAKEVSENRHLNGAAFLHLQICVFMCVYVDVYQWCNGSHGWTLE